MSEHMALQGTYGANEIPGLPKSLINKMGGRYRAGIERLTYYLRLLRLLNSHTSCPRYNDKLNLILLSG